MSYNSNMIIRNDASTVILYIDMNSYFASCEQQLQPKYRNRAIGVCPFLGENPVIIAPSKEAKLFGVKTGMRFQDAKSLCPKIEMVPVRPVFYRQIHVQIMHILRKYCEDVIPKSIDEAVLNLTAYKFIYTDFFSLALQIKKDIREQIGEYVTCSIGISKNVFLAKLATEIQKPDGLIEINEENIEFYFQKLRLTDFPGIASANEKRLNRAGIYNPTDLYNASESLLRKAFGGIVGNYWFYRLHFKKVDLYTSAYKRMSAMRTLSAKTRANKVALMGMLISLCTKLEQRMVKAEVFCKDICFSAAYYDRDGWKIIIKISQPLQDATEMLHYILQKINAYEKQASAPKIFTKNMRSMGVIVGDFIDAKFIQYSLFDNNFKKDLLRKTVYTIKDKYGKNTVRKACEIIEDGHMKDAIGFGSVKDMYEPGALGIADKGFNKYLLEM